MAIGSSLLAAAELGCGEKLGKPPLGRGSRNDEWKLVHNAWAPQCERIGYVAHRVGGRCQPAELPCVYEVVVGVVIRVGHRVHCWNVGSRGTPAVKGRPVDVPRIGVDDTNGGGDQNCSRDWK